MKKVTGERGFSDKTEVLKNLEVGERTKFEKEIDSEIRDTMINIEKQYILIEVWNWNRWSLNDLEGLYLFDIYEIIQGNIHQSCIIEKEDGKSSR